MWDATTYYRAQRDRVRKAAAGQGAEVVLIYLDTPLGEARSRLDRNRVVRSRWDIPDDVHFLSISRDLEPPGADEHPIRYTPETPLTAWMNETIAPLLGQGAQGVRRMTTAAFSLESIQQSEAGIRCRSTPNAKSRWCGARGAYLYDTDGKRYLDAMSNYGVAILGHADPEFTAALSEQLATLATCHQSFYNDPAFGADR